MSFDTTRVYTTSVLPGEEAGAHERSEVVRSFRDFVLEFRLDARFVYREQLRNNLLVRRYALRVNTEHLIGYNEALYKLVRDEPVETVPLFEQAVTEIARRMARLRAEDAGALPAVQVELQSAAAETALRQLDSQSVSRLVRLSGIVVSTSVLTSRATHVALMCRNCRHTTALDLNNFQSLAGSNVALPRACLADHSNDDGSAAGNPCGQDPYMIVHESSRFVDQQFLKLQEVPESVPIGEMPRNLLLTCDRYLTNRVVPGTRVTVVGIYAIYQSKGGQGGARAVAIRNPYVKVLGLEAQAGSPAGALSMFSEEEEEEFLRLARTPNLYQLFAESIAPSIYGNEDIKKAIVCLLMGGSKKLLPDGMRLRGDINVLLLGDPGTAKSQLLKFVEKVSPIAVYTSGKGSSAAGLTASVQRDPNTREFYLEGGAMVLADGGVVCIDEFDKMRDEDRVAIHEAMEQQTISIAKAGITTVLNSRTSVLAAANPIYGRYDELKSPGENIDFQTTILSRFDMIFIVKDEHNEQRDMSIAQHVMNIHTGRTAVPDAGATGADREIPIDKMRRYITYCRSKCAPRLSTHAAEKLSSHFVTIRKQLLINELESKEKSSIPITVRQLEAIIRIAESLAKLELSSVAEERHVDEAIRLFQASTMDAASQDPIGGMQNSNVVSEVRNLEAELKRRLPIGWSTSYQTLKREFVQSGRYSLQALDRALYVLERHETIQLRYQGQNIYRSGV
ncbi:AaceriAGR276Wp [[Ashbya] aceris (nom. inval.)]|nr:AaceriAGR276Wp [[Ashbya] aceris (nom. inval.)]